ncbi:MAG: F0F1 ATP synthase subunit B [Bacilli bacterium]|nr:F0F1 ATP synthase subunit B [Bacilli bacterium]
MRRRRGFLVCFLLPIAGLLCACEGSPFTDADFVAKIFPNGYWDFLIQLLAFIVLLVVVFFVGYKPVSKMLQKRKEGVEKMIQDAEENAAVAKKAALEKDQTIQEGKDEAERIIASARKSAEVQAQEILNVAEAQAAAKRKKVDEDIEAAKAASVEAVRKEIVDVALLASETLLGREVSSEDNKRLVREFVDGLKDDGEGTPK